MASASSSTPFLEIRQENQMTQHQLSSTAASSTTAAPPGVVPPKKKRNQPGTPCK
ncbi:Zinc finger protein NUTCRACKER [Sesbania bispinosa]|nr:Zinc finger protein NUTCRACKER [Sesbania bispinosa]